MITKTFAYCRVSSADQSLERQLEQFRELGINERDIFIDKKSGKDFEREQYQLMKAQIRPGDCLFLVSLDRLGRSYQKIQEEWSSLRSLGCDIVVLDMPILDTRNTEGGLTGKFISDLFLQILSYVAEIERQNIRTRQRQGIELAKAAGKYKGRKPIPTENFPQVYQQVKAGEITARAGMTMLGIKTNTWYRRVKEYEGTL